MFGAVTSINIHEKLVEAGFEALTRKQIQLEAPIKELGQHTVGIKVYQDVEAVLKFDVVSENPIVDEAANDSEADESPASDK